MGRRQAYTALLVLAALACVAGEYLLLRGVVYVAKPLATVAVLLLAADTADPVSPRYRRLVTLGLVASLAGDVLLMLPGDHFVAGLASFLVAHLCYVAAFAGDGGGLRDAPAFVAVSLVAAAMLAYLWPGLGALRLPVVAYVAVIATMAWQALARWRHVRGTGAALAAIGAVSFLASDSALAVRRFRVEFPLATVAVLGSYWVAQWCIARSVRRREDWVHLGSEA